ncbi:hypothetical protein [uncultured Lamprocystis sp.]|nr:hypothetical protein [uncultured Lamprocystis sp.]
MLSVEIHQFVQLGHKFRVGASFYLYQGALPKSRPQQLQLLDLGGNKRYTINHTLGNQMSVFYKGSNLADPAEVTIVLGCGGSITFDGTRQATGFNATTRPKRRPKRGQAQSSRQRRGTIDQ